MSLPVIRQNDQSVPRTTIIAAEACRRLTANGVRARYRGRRGRPLADSYRYVRLIIRATSARNASWQNSRISRTEAPSFTSSSSSSSSSSGSRQEHLSSQQLKRLCARRSSLGRSLTSTCHALTTWDWDDNRILYGVHHITYVWRHDVTHSLRLPSQCVCSLVYFKSLFTIKW